MNVNSCNVLCAVFFVFELVFLIYVMFLYYPNMPVALMRLHSFDALSSMNSSVELVEGGNKSQIWFSTFLLIMVPTRPSDIRSRLLIRDTWFKGFSGSKDVALRFVIGSKSVGHQKLFELTEENGTFGDLIFVDVIEKLSALTNKTLAIINWAHHHVSFSYMMKCDDDTYVFVKNMTDELRKWPTATKLYYGLMLHNIQPIRGNYKWADNEWDLGKAFIPFATGGGYVLSHDLVAILSRESPYLKWHINEDTAIGAWLSTFDHKRRSDKFCRLWKGTKLTSCKTPLVAILTFGYTDNELNKYFHGLHEQVISNVRNLRLTPSDVINSQNKQKPTRVTAT